MFWDAVLARLGWAVGEALLLVVVFIVILAFMAYNDIK
jgi:hypothetical protein